MAKTDVTAALLRKLLSYDPATGELRRLVAAGGQKVGAVAGNVTKRGYLMVNVGGHRVMAHRLAWLYMTGRHPDGVIDHIDGDSLNNRFANLRDVTQAVNLQNQRKPRSPNRSGVLGVWFDKRRGTWNSDIGFDGKRIRLGAFKTIQDAQAAYLAAKRLYHPGCTI
jgi:hypothetical protein